MGDPGSVGEADSAKILLNILCKQTNGLKVVHFNSRSLLPKMDEIRDMISNSLPDVVCISETWLKQEINDNFINIPSYRVYRSDRVARRGGGVAMYVRESIKCKPILRNSNSDLAAEYIFCELGSGPIKCLVGCVYKPPLSNHVNLENDLLHIVPQYDNIIIGGDFNYNFLQISGQACYFNALMGSLDLHRINNEPTHFTNVSSTLLDVFWTNNRSKVLFNNQISLPGISDHDLIFLTYDVVFDTQYIPNTFSFRCYKRINLQALFDDAESIPWSDVRSLPSVDDQVNFLCSALNYLHDRHIPLVTRTIVNAHCPWISNYILFLIRARNRAYIMWKRFRSSNFWEDYRTLRNRVSCAISIAKKRYYSSILSTDLPNKQLWTNLKSLGIKSNKKTNCEADPEELNNNFLSNYPSSSSGIDAESLSQLLQSSPDSHMGFSFLRVTEVEVCEAVKCIKSSATGLDSVNPKFVRLLLPYLLTPFAHVCNTCFMTSSFPSSFKYSKVIPVPKHTSEFRPISILPFLSKIIEKIMSVQISNYLLSNSLLHDHQSGFRSKHSCITALLRITNDVRVAMDNDMFTTLVFLDFSKAFDSVDHGILCRKLLTNFNFSSHATRLIFNYLSNRFQAVYSNGRLSSFRAVNSGVPQGSILGPLLFILFVNDIFSCINYCQLHLYADDAQLYLSRSVGLVEDAIYCLNLDLESINQWSVENKLSLNPDKTKCLVIYRTLLDTGYFPPVKLNDTDIAFVDSVRNLGVIFNRTLTWNDHIDSLIRRVFGGLRALWASSSYTPFSTRLLLARSLLIPVITYGCEVFSQLDSLSFYKLNMAFNSIVRYVHCLRRYDHISQYVSSILGCSFSLYLKFRCLIFLAKIIKFQSPKYLHDCLQYGRSTRTVTFIIPRSNTVTSKRQFFVHTVKLWNSLPISLKNSLGASTLNCFRNSLFLYLNSHYNIFT